MDRIRRIVTKMEENWDLVVLAIIGAVVVGATVWAVGKPVSKLRVNEKSQALVECNSSPDCQPHKWPAEDIPLKQDREIQLAPAKVK
jgi:hypothetical protein